MSDETDKHQLVFCQLKVEHDGQRIIIDPGEEDGSWGRLINHSSVHPNAKGERRVLGGEVHILIVAIKDIRAGQEIFFDYGNQYTTVPACVEGCKQCARK